MTPGDATVATTDWRIMHVDTPWWVRFVVCSSPSPQLQQWCSRLKTSSNRLQKSIGKRKEKRFPWNRTINNTKAGMVALECRTIDNTKAALFQSSRSLLLYILVLRIPGYAHPSRIILFFMYCKRNLKTPIMSRTLHRKVYTRRLLFNVGSPESWSVMQLGVPSI
jgi:hypothetical protein